MPYKAILCSVLLCLLGENIKASPIDSLLSFATGRARKHFMESSDFVMPPELLTREQINHVFSSSRDLERYLRTSSFEAKHEDATTKYQAHILCSAASKESLLRTLEQGYYQVLDGHSVPEVITHCSLRDEDSEIKEYLVNLKDPDKHSEMLEDPSSVNRQVFFRYDLWSKDQSFLIARILLTPHKNPFEDFDVFPEDEYYRLRSTRIYLEEDEYHRVFGE